MRTIFLGELPIARIDNDKIELLHEDCSVQEGGK